MRPPISLGIRARGLVITMRPRQWVKNGLVVVAPAAAGVLSHASIIRNTAVSVVAFCLLSSGVYLLNDARDVDADRAHPTKKNRPLAAGIVSPLLAIVTAVVLMAGSLALTALVPQPTPLLCVLGLYLLLQLAYVYRVKHIPVFELIIVASGFFLRALAGASASHLYVSEWFLVVIGFGALFLVAGKRSAEIDQLGNGAVSVRAVLKDYTPRFLHHVVVMTGTVVLTGYCLWAFDTSSTGLSSIHHYIVPIRLTVVPVVIAMLHIMRILDSGQGSAPEDLLLSDRVVQGLVVVWAILFVVGVYA